MPRQKSVQNQDNIQNDFNYALEFAKSLTQVNSYLFNPLLANVYLKNINMQPAGQTREHMKQIISNPREHEQALRRLSQYLYNTQLTYKRMIHYLSDILTFDWFPIPINATEEDMNKSTFKKDYEIMCNWFDRFNAKKEFKKAVLKMCLEDGYFVHLREDKKENVLFLQEMPIDWCIIDSYWEYGYLYSFNLMYFQQMGVDINGFAPEFKKYYKNALDMQKNKTYYPNIRPELRNGKWNYWQQISPEKGWVFKFHTHFAGLVPPLMGIFLDFADIPHLKDLQKIKADSEVLKVILGAVPRNKENKTGSKVDDFAIDPNTLAKFIQVAQSDLPSGVKIAALPFENLEMFSFDNTSETKDDIMSKALNNIFAQAGIDRNGFNTERPNVATMNLSKLIDSAFMESIYEQFEDFCTYHVNRLTRKYKFKIKFEGTIFDREDRQKHALELAQNGFITPKIASAEGMSIKELDSGMLLMKWLGFPDKLTPIKTAYTMSKEDSKGGRPKGDIKTEASEITETAGSNIDKDIDEYQLPND